MRHCEKCGEKGYHPEILPLTLVGGYHAELCVSCQNMFHEYVYAKMLPLGQLEARREAAIADGNSEQASEVTEKIHRERTYLYTVSKTWVEIKKK